MHLAARCETGRLGLVPQCSLQLTPASEEPGAEIRPRFEAVVEAVATDKRILDEVLRIARVARHAQSGAVQGVEVLEGFFFEPGSGGGCLLPEGGIVGTSRRFGVHAFSL